MGTEIGENPYLKLLTMDSVAMASSNASAAAVAATTLLCIASCNIRSVKRYN